MTANASARPTSSSASSAHGRTLFSVSPAASPKSNTFSFSPPNIRETRTLRQTLSHMFLRPDPKLSRTPSTQAHSATVHSPLISEFSPASSTQTTSSSATKEASSGSFPPSVSTDSPQSPPGERTPLGLSPLARSFLGIVGLSNRLRSTPASSPTKSPVADTQRRERVAQMVDEYMALNDRQTNGYVTVANERRVLGLGPKRVEQKHLYYEVFGTGPRRLFLVMGMLGCTMYWRLQSRYFASLGDYTICVFDNCGSGRSTVAPGPYKVTQLARDAMAVLDHLGWKDSVHAVGVSLGGMIVQEMCLMDRVQFETVVLVDTWHSAGLAVPTAKEVTFAFKGMSALGTSPKHLIDLVFSRDWVRAPFRDMIGLEPKPHEPAIKDEPSEPPELTNGEVMLALFQAIQDDLGIQPLTVDPTPESSPGIPVRQIPDALDGPDVLESEINAAGTPGLHRAVSRLVEEQNIPPIHHSKSASQVTADKSSPQPSTLSSTRTAPTNFKSSGKRDTAGDMHQFIACLGHRLTPARVRQIRQKNPNTRFLVIHGEKDKVIRPLCGRTLAKLLECSIVWLPGAGHMPVIDAHCTFNLVLRAFTRNEEWLGNLHDGQILGSGESESKMDDEILDAPMRIRRYNNV